MISMAAIPVAGRAGGHASSSRLAHAANAFSSARAAAESGGVVAIAVVLLVTGASDQRRRLRSAAEDMFFRVLQPAAEGPFRSQRCRGVQARMTYVMLTIDAAHAMLQDRVRAGVKAAQWLLLVSYDR